MMVVAGYHAHWRDLISSSLGGMAERTNALVLKTSVVKATEGSNPSPSTRCRSDNVPPVQMRILLSDRSGTLTGLLEPRPDSSLPGCRRSVRVDQSDERSQSAHLPRMAKCLGSMVKPRFDFAEFARPRNISGGASIMIPQSAHMKWAWAWLASR